MKRLLVLAIGLVLLLAIVGCHHYAGVCDCEANLYCPYDRDCAPLMPPHGPSATILQPAPIASPALAPAPAPQSKEPEKIAAPGK